MHSRVTSRWVPLIALAAMLSAVPALVFADHPPTVSRTSVAKPILPGALAPAVTLAAADVPAPLGRFFEVGYAVSDLGTAMARFTQVLGVQWNPIQSGTLPVRLQYGQVEVIHFDTVVSAQGPPYVELVHASGASGANPWQATSTFSPTHIGFAVTNLAARSDALVAAGFPRIATVDVPGQSAAVFAYHRGPGNITIELVDATIAPPGVCDTAGSVFCAP
jgi:hypothetical protein